MSFDDILQTSAAPEVAAPAKKQAARRRALVVGGPPKVSLLPAEVRDAGRARLLRRGLVGVVAVSVAASAFGVVLAGTVADAAAQRSAAAEDRTRGLALQIAKFADVARLDQAIELGTAASAVGSSTTIDWSQQYDDLVADMPSDYVVKTVAADSATVTGAYDQGDSPLERPRVATVILGVDAPSTARLPMWLRELRSTPAYADATASWTAGVGDVQSSGGAVTITLTVHLDKNAFVDQQETR